MEQIDDIAEEQQVRVPKEADSVAKTNEIRTKILEQDREVYLVGLGGASFKFIETVKEIHRENDEYDTVIQVSEMNVQTVEFEPEDEGGEPDTAVGFVAEVVREEG